MAVKEIIDHGNKMIMKKEDAMKHEVSLKRRKSGSSSEFMEIKVEPRGKSLEDIDSEKLKDDIKRWAKAVVVYAYQVSTPS
ncbi:hypothetical protein Ancab_012395 [Ancistrocladus abbreviatus]